MPDEDQTAMPDKPLDIARRELDEQLAAAAREIITWRRTGVLPSGSIVARVAEGLRADFPHDATQQAERIVVALALEGVAAQ